MGLMYQIFTEDKNREAIKAILNCHLQGYTILSGQGIWKGKAEPALIIVVLDDDANKIQNAVDEIKRVNEQESVLIVSSECAITFL